MIQVKLKSHDTHLTCWVDKYVKTGDRVTLKHAPAVLWDVIWVSQPTDEIPNRGWKVGGL
jgi:hypothetical protein